MPRKEVKATERLANPVIPSDKEEAAEKTQQEAFQLTLKLCCNCNKPVGMGYYGKHGDGGTCTKYCEDEYRAKKPSMLDFQVGKTTKGARHVDARTGT